MSSAASERAGAASGTSTTSSCPARTLWAGSTATPSTSTRPSFASRAMALRESSVCAARNRSTRPPPSSTRRAIRSATSGGLGRGRAALLEPERRGHEHDADDDRGVRDVECPEPDVADADIHEVDHVTLRDAVEQIPGGAAELHPECRRNDPGAARDLSVVVDDRENGHDREGGEGWRPLV